MTMLVEKEKEIVTCYEYAVLQLYECNMATKTGTRKFNLWRIKNSLDVSETPRQGKTKKYTALHSAYSGFTADTNESENRIIWAKL